MISELPDIAFKGGRKKKPQSEDYLHGLEVRKMRKETERDVTKVGALQ